MSSLLQSLTNSKTVYAPNYVPADPYSANVGVFLAGSIDLGEAEDWQPVVTKAIEHLPATGLIYNPRRLDFQKDAQQSIHNGYFKEQVDWELDHLDASDIIFMYLDPKSKSPISLMELGYIVRDKKVIVCCAEGFWRKGNVDVICARNGIPVFEDLQLAINALKELIVDLSIVKSDRHQVGLA